MKREIYLAGGCFWGLQKYMDDEVIGVVATECGYANGRGEKVTYEEVCSQTTGFCETVKVVYDDNKTSLDDILREYFYTIDPTSVNRQGADIGEQYRTGIYYSDANDATIVRMALSDLQKGYRVRIAVEEGPIEKFIPAEEYHQKYLDKNPGGYCHINFEKIRKLKAAVVDAALYEKPSGKELRERLAPVQYDVTQLYMDEKAENDIYAHCSERGLYVDIATGEPLFSSADKLEDFGRTAFRKPVDPNVIMETGGLDGFGDDESAAVSRVGRSYIGRIRRDAGEKYLANSSALRFVPYDELEKQGYGYLIGKIEI